MGILVAIFLGSLEVVLDRGQIDDWFGSNFIVTFAAMSAVALLLFIPWELSRARPLIDLHMLTSRQFGTCFLVMLGTGALLIATTQALPQFCRINTATRRPGQAWRFRRAAQSQWG